MHHNSKDNVCSMHATFMTFKMLHQTSNVLKDTHLHVVLFQDCDGREWQRCRQHQLRVGAGPARVPAADHAQDVQVLRRQVPGPGEAATPASTPPATTSAAATTTTEVQTPASECGTSTDPGITYM